MIYADEDFYKEKYLLGRKPVISTGFPFYARQASQVIDWYTFDRLVAQTEVPKEVRMCCCELAEAVVSTRESGKGFIWKDFGKDRNLFRFLRSCAGDEQTLPAKKERQIVMKWLDHTGLCYQGVE